MSSCRMRAFGPEPLTRARSTPSSRANLRTDGDACACLKAASSTGAAVAADSFAADVDADAEATVAAGGAAGTGAGAAAGAAEDVDGAVDCVGFAALDAAAAPPVSTTTIGEPSLTLSPTFTFTSLTVPAAGDGTSIVALSD